MCAHGIKKLVFPAKSAVYKKCNISLLLCDICLCNNATVRSAFLGKNSVLFSNTLFFSLISQGLRQKQ